MMQGRIGKPPKSRNYKKLKNVSDEHDRPPQKKRLQNRKFAEDRRNRKSGPVNQRPNDLDEQEIPYTLREFMRIKEMAKTQPPKKKKKKRSHLMSQADQGEMVYGMTRPVKQVADLRRKKNESEWAWNRRVDGQARVAINEANLEEKFDVNIAHNEKGVITVTDKKESKTKEKMRRRLKEKKEKKKKERQNKHIEKQLDFDGLSDHVEFGEVVSQPPTLSAKPRKSSASADKPGKRSLLLSEIMQGTDKDKKIHKHSKTTPSGQTLVSNKPRKPGQVVKRKHLAPVQKRVMDAKRLEAIDMYRQLKKRKNPATD